MQPRKVEPGPGQESVWDYPRPPRVERIRKHLKVHFNDEVVAETRHGLRVLETSHPPTYYFPPEDVRLVFLEKQNSGSLCEWKGYADHYLVDVWGKRAMRSAWSYADPNDGYGDLEGYFAFHAGMMDACFVDGELVVPQPGAFYGGWITAEIVGPFKGGPGTLAW